MLRITGYVSRFKANILAKDELNEIKFDNLILPGTKESKKGWLIFEKAFAVNKEKIWFYLFQRWGKSVTSRNKN